ncbi:Transcriptional regulatory protein YpdB [Burkholderiales bacterium]|nr:Transcriptional regulatory protein YpdB [Burkholderiales bacterium]
MGTVARTLKAVIAEDEPVLRVELRDSLAKLWPELDVCAEAEDGIAALREIAAHAPDILFLDIQMPGLSGLEVAKHANGKCHVVFVTAYDNYALSAFEQGAVDYVMKPFSAARLATTIERLKAKAASAPANLDGLIRALADAAGTRKEYMRWITASQGSELRLITVEEVLYFQADNKYTLVVTADKESLIRRPIKELIDELDPQAFWQIHRSTLVNVNAIAGVTRDMGGRMRVRVKGRKETLAVSEPYYGLFKQM